MIGYVWNSFFGVCTDLAFTCFGQIFEGEERDGYQQGVLGMSLIGGAVVAFIVMPFSNNPENGANYFNSLWLSMGLTALALVLVTLLLVPPAQRKENKDKDSGSPSTQSGDQGAAAHEMAPRVILLLKILLVASALDSGGDEGTRMARSTILSSLFPEWSTTFRQNMLLLALLFILIITMVVLGLLKKVTSLPIIAVIGCGFTLATQLLLMFEIDSAAVFLIIWHFGKLFGFLSTLSASFIITEVCPKSQLGYWNGMNQACSNISMAASPLIFSAVYDAMENVRGQEMLACPATVSFLATLAYVPLIWMMPKPQKKMKIELEDLETYEKMTDLEWKELPLEIVDQVSEKLVEAGKTPRVMFWGDYHEELPRLHALQDRATKDFQYLTQSLTRLLLNREALVQEQQSYKKFMEMMPHVDRVKASKDMGTWLSNYLDDAGYPNWETQSPIFKAMIMNAFPLVDVLNEKKTEFHTMPIEVFEDNMVKFIKVMDSHLATDRRNRSLGGHGMFTTLIRRR